MFCSKCGNEMKEGEKFCSKCGNEINSEENKEKTKPKGLSVIQCIAISFIVLIIIMVIASSYNSKQIEQATNKAAQQLKENTTYSQ